MSTGRVVIGGSTGFMGSHLVSRLRAEGREVVTISRSGADIRWGDQVEIDRAVDGASLVIGLAGKSVNCRYTPENRAEIFRSRLDTTTSLSTAIARASAPPALWVNSSTATIYRHAEDRPMTESTGELGTGFSVEVAKAWEKALFAEELPATRRVALRSAIVLGHGGVLGPLKNLVRLGLGGPQYDGRWPATAARRRAGTVHHFRARRGSQRSVVGAHRRRRAHHRLHRADAVTRGSRQRRIPESGRQRRVHGDDQAGAGCSRRPAAAPLDTRARRHRHPHRDRTRPEEPVGAAGEAHRRGLRVPPPAVGRGDPRVLRPRRVSA